MADWTIVVALAFIVVLTVVLKISARHKPEAESDCDNHRCGTCNEAGGCGLAAVMTARNEAIASEEDYFDDDELDRFKGIKANGYTAADVSEFAQVMRTMRKDEVGKWVAGLRHRGVLLPDALRNEAEERAGKRLFSRSAQ